MASKSPKVSAPVTAIVLLRVSTGAQAASGLGLEAQEAACRRLCAARGWPVLSVHQDAGISGRYSLKKSFEKRPGLKAAVEAVKATPGAVLVVYSLSRLTRTQRMTIELLDPNGDYRLPLVSATEPFDTSTSVGQAMIGMLAVFAQLEGEMISARTTAALGAAKARGIVMGAPSMVEVVEGGVRSLDPEKVALVRQVQKLYATEIYTLRSLADYLNENNIPSVNGAKWHKTTVATAVHTKLPA